MIACHLTRHFRHLCVREIFYSANKRRENRITIAIHIRIVTSARRSCPANDIQCPLPPPSLDGATDARSPLARIFSWNAIKIYFPCNTRITVNAGAIISRLIIAKIIREYSWQSEDVRNKRNNNIIIATRDQVKSTAIFVAHEIRGLRNKRRLDARWYARLQIN